MYRNRQNYRQAQVKPFYYFTSSNKQQGSALVLAIFVMVVMTVLGAALVRMMSSSTETVAYEVLGTKAYAVAQSGVQWTLQQLFPLDSDAQSCPTQAEINVNKPDFSLVEGMESCNIMPIDDSGDNNLTCTSFTRDDGNGDVTYYTITSRATCSILNDEGEFINLTSRAVQVEARSL